MIIGHYFMVFLLCNLIVLIKFVKLLTVEWKSLTAGHTRCLSGAV